MTSVGPLRQIGGCTWECAANTLGQGWQSLLKLERNTAAKFRTLHLLSFGRIAAGPPHSYCRQSLMDPWLTLLRWAGGCDRGFETLDIGLCKHAANATRISIAIFACTRLLSLYGVLYRFCIRGYVERSYAVLRLSCALERFSEAPGGECAFDQSSPCWDPKEASSPFAPVSRGGASSTCASLMIKLHGYALTRSGVSFDTFLRKQGAIIHAPV
jgi:hypothetical protein